MSSSYSFRTDDEAAAKQFLRDADSFIRWSSSKPVDPDLPDQRVDVDFQYYLNHEQIKEIFEELVDNPVMLETFSPSGEYTGESKSAVAKPIKPVTPEELKQLRKEKGIKAKDIANALEVSLSDLLSFEQGERELSSETLRTILRYIQAQPQAQAPIQTQSEPHWSESLELSPTKQVFAEEPRSPVNPEWERMLELTLEQPVTSLSPPSAEDTSRLTRTYTHRGASWSWVYSDRTGFCLTSPQIAVKIEPLEHCLTHEPTQLEWGIQKRVIVQGDNGFNQYEVSRDGLEKLIIERPTLRLELRDLPSDFWQDIQQFFLK